eukprot:scaffold498639_cov15-Prasinocladus_malaysianus.AAC.1
MKSSASKRHFRRLDCAVLLRALLGSFRLSKIPKTPSVDPDPRLSDYRTVEMRATAAPRADAGNWPQDSASRWAAANQCEMSLDGRVVDDNHLLRGVFWWRVGAAVGAGVSWLGNGELALATE